jgi:TPR repeat protein
MYPCYFDATAAETSEVVAFRADCEALGVVSEMDNWYVTEEWAGKFSEHLRRLRPLAESGNPLAQYSVAVIYMIGYTHSSLEDRIASYQDDVAKTTDWLVRAARQGMVVAIDNLITHGQGPEVERLRSIAMEVDAERKSDKVFELGETWRRAYGDEGHEGK